METIVQSNTNKRVVLYKYLHGVLPKGDTLMKYGVISSLPKCSLCNQRNFTSKHLFIQCRYFHLTRSHLLDELKETDYYIKWDETFFGYLHNKKSASNLVDLKVIEKICDYIYHVWMVFKQTK